MYIIERSTLTSYNVNINHSHPQIIHPNPPINTSAHNLMFHHTHRRNTILRLRKHHKRFMRLRLRIPQPNRTVVTPYSQSQVSPDQSSPSQPFPPLPGPPSNHRTQNPDQREPAANSPETTTSPPAPPNAQAFTRPTCPLHRLSVRPLATSHRNTVLSPPTLMKRALSSETAMSRTS